MGLASAMSTALTGLSAAETQISVVGNNLANSNTVGFKASDVTFATQFLQTQSVGSSPTATTGGQNPTQQGLGAMVAEITPNFSQGTISTSNSPTNLAIQGDGFFIAQGSSGQMNYTRNGTFTTNAENQLVTSTGNRVMGFGINSQFQIDSTQLQPLQVPLGTATVAKATQIATMQGALTPIGDVANTAQIIKTSILTDGSKTFPQSGPTTALAMDNQVPAQPLAGVLTGTYKYYVTYANGNLESRPQLVPVNSPLLNNNQVSLTNIPATLGSQWTSIRLYRNVNDEPGDTNFYRLADLSPAQAAAGYTDNATDATIRAGGNILNMTGPAITSQTVLKDVVVYDGNTYQKAFPGLNLTTDAGTLNFTGTKGGNTLTTQSLQVTGGSTLKDVATFLQGALGIQQAPGGDPNNPIPVDSASGLPPGATITSDGALEIVGNNGLDNAISVGLSSMSLTTSTIPPTTASVIMPFNTIQQAKGTSAKADMIVYDSLGIPLSVRVTAVLQDRTSTNTIYRWFADCGQNDPAPGQEGIAVGTGVVKFDGQGNFISSSNSTVAIGRFNEPSVKPLQFSLDFSKVSGLASATASLSVSRQDGSAPGVLNSFTIGQDGVINGVFSNGISQTLGQIRLARFSNPTGLEQVGQNMYSSGVNSGLPIEGNPGAQGMGAIVAGSLELSNTDVGASLINLILSSTMYRSNTRVITTGQQMFDELLNLIR